MIKLKKESIIECLDSCFNIDDNDIVTRWAKCVLLCAMSSKLDSTNYNFISRTVFCMTLLEILSEPNDTTLPNSIISESQALEYLGYFELSDEIMSDDGYELGLASILESINFDNLYEMCNSLI